MYWKLQKRLLLRTKFQLTCAQGLCDWLLADFRPRDERNSNYDADEACNGSKQKRRSETTGADTIQRARLCVELVKLGGDQVEER